MEARDATRPGSAGGRARRQECVEVATCAHAVHLRDSKVSDGPTFAVAPAAWSVFLSWRG
ncbi:DUF397 domain-containing protein [Streptomyces sp. NPDC003035]|uniref:DUF397 domain-containing protein n=1 Tax=Streptomyces sp. NPDC003035 TaxID=3364676 RepID=UPI00368BDE8C